MQEGTNQEESYKVLEFPVSKQGIRQLYYAVFGPVYGMLLILYALWMLMRFSEVPNPYLSAILGMAVVVVVGQLVGETRTRAKYVEMKVEGEYFYVLSISDIVKKRKVKWYPIEYANPVKEGNALTINYIDQPIRLQYKEWGDQLNRIAWELGFHQN